MKAISARLSIVQQWLGSPMQLEDRNGVSAAMLRDCMTEMAAIAETLPDQPGNVMVLGCICPAGSNAACHSPICPRAEWKRS